MGMGMGMGMGRGIIVGGDFNNITDRACDQKKYTGEHTRTKAK